MTMTEKLRQAQKETGSMLCVGLDPDFKKIPPSLLAEHGRGAPAGLQGLLEDFLEQIVEATAPHCCAFKPNFGFYLDFGGEGSFFWAGVKALQSTISFIRQNYPDHLIILDGKFNDIGNTAEHYASYAKRIGADAVTVNPYLGPKTLEPFLKAGLGIFALCVTSNPDAAIFQNMEIIVPDAVGDCNDRQTPVYSWVAEVLTRGKSIHGCAFERTEIWNGQLGLVTGATHPEELGNIRKLVGDDIVLLIPGIGKQGGDLEATVRNNGRGLAVINSSSAILYASNGEDWAKAAKAEAKKTNDEINALRNVI